MCDQAVGAQCVRGHRWPWLRDESGEHVAVDGWWPDLDVAWTVTATGIAAVETWIARCMPLFRGWPPDHPGADDAVG